MAMNDLLSDALARIRNAQMARLPEVVCLYSGLVAGVLTVLKEEGYIDAFAEEADESGKKQLRVALRYDEGQPVIRTLTRVSKPGRRVYSAIKDLPKYYNGLGLSILSTSQGVISDFAARKRNIGGEVLCNVF